MSGGYDSKADTLEHIAAVRDGLEHVVSGLLSRGRTHDRSKLAEPEKAVFDRVTPQLQALTYGSDEYKASLAEMGVALEHHYAHNPHHPEHYPDGIRGMSLVDIVEMLCDWLAAVKRHEDGDIRRSVEMNQERFGYGDELRAILHNTLDWMGVPR